MTDKLKQKKLSFGDVFPHALNFVVVFATFASELSMIVEGFIEKELTVSSSAFFLYIGTLLSLGMNELVYESVKDNHPKTHKALIVLSAIGSSVSLFAVMVCTGTWWDKYPCIKFWFFHILRCIVVLTYAALCFPCLNKTIALWKEKGNEQNDKVELDSDESLSDFDIAK